MKNHYIENGVNWEDLQKDSPMAVNMVNALGWKDYADFVGNNIKNCYWVSEEMLNQFREDKREENKDIIEAKIRTSDALTILSDDPRMGTTTYCKTCPIWDKCPFYEKGASCKFNVVGKIDTPDKMADLFQNILALQSERIMRASLVEKIRGGDLNKELSGEMALLMKMFETAKKMAENEESITISAKGKSSSQSIVQKIFGDIMPEESEEDPEE
jgi:hypothetical protein